DAELRVEELNARRDDHEPGDRRDGSVQQWRRDVEQHLDRQAPGGREPQRSDETVEEEECPDTRQQHGWIEMPGGDDDRGGIQGNADEQHRPYACEPAPVEPILAMLYAMGDAEARDQQESVDRGRAAEGDRKLRGGVDVRRRQDQPVMHIDDNEREGEAGDREDRPVTLRNYSRRTRKRACPAALKRRQFG